MCGLLWEEVRPVKTLELTWPADAKHRPVPEELAITTLNNQGSASSWWNNLIAVKQAVKPTLSGEGRTYVYDLGKDTCGIVVSVVGDKIAANYDVPTVRVLTADAWKRWTSRSNGALMRPLPRRITAGGSEPMMASRLDCTHSMATATLPRLTRFHGTLLVKMPPVGA